MFAVIQTGGKQYKVESGQTLLVEKLPGNAQETITFDSVLLAGGEGSPKDTSGITVAAEIIDQVKADKVIIFKKKRRHTYRRKNGHRQQLTLLRIGNIEQNGKVLSEAPAKADKPVKTEAATDAKQSAPLKAAAEKAPAKKAAAPKTEAVDKAAAAPKKTAAKKPATKPSKE